MNDIRRNPMPPTNNQYNRTPLKAQKFVRARRTLRRLVSNTKLVFVLGVIALLGLLAGGGYGVYRLGYTKGEKSGLQKATVNARTNPLLNPSNQPNRPKNLAVTGEITAIDQKNIEIKQVNGEVKKLTADEKIDIRNAENKVIELKAVTKGSRATVIAVEGDKGALIAKRLRILKK
ncbi:hypothetical protein KBC99_00935 [Candidatus Saccharibacteria bacterium]|nr:hypothetical protein [Candidatus Saccharibacteria bacterium]